MQYILFPFGPIVEPYEGAQCFLSDDPKWLTKNAWSKSLPMIVGGCSDEGLLFYNSELSCLPKFHTINAVTDVLVAVIMKEAKTLNSIDLANAVPFQEFGFDPRCDCCQKLGQSMKRFYFGFSPISGNTIGTYLMVSSNCEHSI